MPKQGFWERIREARLVRVLLVYLAASWVVLQATALMRSEFQLPPWVTPLTVLLLLIGLIIIAATAWVQSHPLAAERAEREEIPGSWEIDLGDLGKSVTRGRLPHLTWGRAILGGVVAFSLLFGLAGLYVLVQDRGRPLGPEEASAAPAPAVAVVPFRVVGEDVALWREGLVDLVSTNLDGVGGLRTIDPRVVLSRWHADVGQTTEASPPQALQVARDLGARHVLLGSMVVLGGEVRLAAQLYDVRTGRPADEVQVKGSPDSVPALVDRLSIEVLRSGVGGEDLELPGLDAGRVSTTSIPALKSYLLGEQAFRRLQWEEAAAHFERAVEADSTFGLAVYRLGTTYGWIEGPSPRTIEQFQRASRIADGLPERERLLIEANADPGPGSIEILERLVARYPDDVEGWYALADVNFHWGASLLRPFDEWRNAFRQALDLDPTFGPAYVHLIDDAFAREDSAEARRLVERYEEIDPAAVETAGSRLAYTLAWGDEPARAATHAAFDTIPVPMVFDAASVLRWAPSAAEEAIRAARALVSKPLSERRRMSLVWTLTTSHMSRGWIRDWRESLRTLPREEPYETAASRQVLVWRIAGFPDSAASRAAAEALARNPTPIDRFLVGALAADEGKPDDLRREVLALRSAAGREEPRDYPGPADREALASLLEAYAARREPGGPGRLALALSRLVGGCPGDPCLPHSALRFEVGRLLFEQGDLAEAERYFRSVEIFLGFARAKLYLGKIREAAGDLDGARAEYATFVRRWQDSDPELRPLWEEGRQALQRLSAVRRL